MKKEIEFTLVVGLFGLICFLVGYAINYSNPKEVKVFKGMWNNDTVEFHLTEGWIESIDTTYFIVQDEKIEISSLKPKENKVSYILMDSIYDVMPDTCWIGSYSYVKFIDNNNQYIDITTENNYVVIKLNCQKNVNIDELGNIKIRTNYYHDWRQYLNY